MSGFKNMTPKIHSAAMVWFLTMSLVGLTSVSAFSQDRGKPETFEATARGTEAQAGKEVPITLIVYKYSDSSDKQTLTEAFQRDKDQGLYDALSKMKAVGHIAVTGGLGYDVSYIEMTQTSTGRTIRFVTNRLLRIGEEYRDSRSTAYNLTAGELNLNDSDKNKSAGVLYPEAQFAMDAEGQLKINLIGFPWQLVDIIDRY
jgi:hypothetical protein